MTADKYEQLGKLLQEKNVINKQAFMGHKEKLTFWFEMFT